MLPIYDKPLIYYPLSVLMLAGIHEILIITTEHDIPIFKKLLGNGSMFGITLSYAVQPSPDGIAQAFLIGEQFIGRDRICLILGDNIFYGDGLFDLLKDAGAQSCGATVFGYHVANPESFGVLELDKLGKVVSIQEKPEKPKSNFAVTGLYFYDNRVIQIAKKIKPSSRGELEITDVNNEYIKAGELKVKLMGRGFAWLDTGTHDSLLEASNFVKTIETRQGLKVACLEEISYKKGWMNAQEVRAQGEALKKTEYGKYLLRMLTTDVSAF